MNNLSRYAPTALAVLRIVVALLFIAHGTQKLFGFPASSFPMGDGGLPPLMLAAALLEIVGGLLILVGFFTRPVAFVLAGEMVVAYWMAHAPASFFPINNGGEAAILFCFAFLYFVFAGPGVLSIDHARGKAA